MKKHNLNNKESEATEEMIIGNEREERGPASMKRKKIQRKREERESKNSSFNTRLGLLALGRA